MDYCQIFGLSIAAADMTAATEWVCEKLNELKGTYITFANTHAVVMAQESLNILRYRMQQQGFLPMALLLRHMKGSMDILGRREWQDRTL